MSASSCDGITQCTTKDSEFKNVCDKCRTLCANYGSAQDSSNPSAGIATLEIFQDLTNLTASKGTVNLSTTAKWRNDLFYGSSVALPNVFLPRDFAVPLFTVSLFLCVSHVFYNEFYGFVERENSELASYPYLDGESKIKSYLQQLLTYASKGTDNLNSNVPTWKQYLGSVDWWSSSALCPLPLLVPKTTNAMLVPVPYTVFQTSIETEESAQRDAFLSRAVASLVGDPLSNIINAETKTSFTGTTVLSVLTVDRTQIACYCLDTHSVNGTTTDAPRFLQKPLSDVLPGEVILYVVVQAEIKTWSPMLYAYVKRLSNPDVVLNEMLATYMIPQVEDWQTFACGSSGGGASTQDCYTQYCRYYIVPDKSLITRSDDIQKLFVNNADAACVCLRTSYGPATTPVYNNTTAMCFGAQCTADPSTLSELGLPDTTCEKQCSTMDTWLHSSEITDPSQLNTERFKALCGEGGGGGGGGTGKRRLSVNWFWLVGVFLLFFFISFYACYFPFSSPGTGTGWIHTSRTRHILFAGGTVVGAGMAVFLGLFLYGNPVCNQTTKKAECISQLTNSQLPASFCSKTIFCECVQDKDCGNNNICDRGACHPINGKMPPYPNSPFPSYDIGLGILVLLAVVVCMFSLRIPSKNVYWGLNLGVVFGVAVLLAVLIMYT